MGSETENGDWDIDFEDNNFKSCFARSVAVNRQSKQSKPVNYRQLQTDGTDSSSQTFKRLPPAGDPTGEDGKKTSGANGNDLRRMSCSSISGSRRASICSSRISEIPVENIVQQSKVNTIQWRLGEVEKSREMYKALMKQVVTFLEKAHRNLELLGNRLNAKSTFPRSKSEHQILAGENGVDTLKTTDDYETFKDFTWSRSRRPSQSSEEIAPEKLSQEAYRLLRTAQSLLNTQEPKLTSAEDIPDLEFLAQLAKEFPQTPDSKPQRATSFSLNPKLLVPDREIKISTAFNRKLSLQLNETRRTTYKFNQRSSLFIDPSSDHYSKSGSVSSVEDESGFSSMNSFQDVGLPVVGEEVNAKNALLRSMLHNNGDSFNSTVKSDDCDVKLWKKPERRWPDDSSNAKQSVTVLWV